MKPDRKPTINERRLAKLLREMDGGDETPPNAWYQSSAAYLAKRGVLAVSKATVTLADATRLVAMYPDAFRAVLRNLARGAR